MITCFTALMEVYLYAWPAQYMDDMVKIVYMYIYINYLYKLFTKIYRNYVSI